MRGFESLILCHTPQPHPWLGVLFCCRKGFEPIPKQSSSGALLAASLHGGNTTAHSNPSSSAIPPNHIRGWGFILLQEGIRTHFKAKLQWSFACRQPPRRQHNSIFESLIPAFCCRPSVWLAFFLVRMLCFSEKTRWFLRCWYRFAAGIFCEWRYFNRLGKLLN